MIMSMGMYIQKTVRLIVDMIMVAIKSFIYKPVKASHLF